LEVGDKLIIGGDGCDLTVTGTLTIPDLLIGGLQVQS
jgi:hypothetical protein